VRTADRLRARCAAAASGTTEYANAPTVGVPLGCRGNLLGMHLDTRDIILLVIAVILAVALFHGFG
jgi:hypothetical protein